MANFCKACGTPIRLDNGEWVHYRDLDHKVIPPNVKIKRKLGMPILMRDGKEYFNAAKSEIFDVSSYLKGIEVELIHFPDEKAVIYLAYYQPATQSLNIWVNIEKGEEEYARGLAYEDIIFSSTAEVEKVFLLTEDELKINHSVNVG